MLAINFPETEPIPSVLQGVVGMQGVAQHLAGIRRGRFGKAGYDFAISLLLLLLCCLQTSHCKYCCMKCSFAISLMVVFGSAVVVVPPSCQAEDVCSRSPTPTLVLFLNMS